MTEQNFEQMRRAMVSNSLRTTGVSDPRVLAAIGAVPRERFVSDACHAIAYADTMVPLGDGRELNSPLSLGRMLSEAEPEPHEKALVIGAATGYAAAVVARLAGSVVAVEEDARLVAKARENLAGTSVQIVEAPLTEGYAAGGPYDFILIDGAVEFVPDAIVAQMVDGGRIAAALLENGVSRIAIGRRAGDGFGLAAISDSASTVLPGFVRPRAFTF